MGTYNMVLSRAAFFHKKYLDLYTHAMPPSIQDYIARERCLMAFFFTFFLMNFVLEREDYFFFLFSYRNCEDIAMSLHIANATGAPPIWVKGNDLSFLFLGEFMSNYQKFHIHIF